MGHPASLARWRATARSSPSTSASILAGGSSLPGELDRWLASDPPEEERTEIAEDLADLADRVATLIEKGPRELRHDAKPAMLRSFAAMKWTVTGAISEMIDNSFGLGRGNASRCHVTYDPKQRRLTVLDNGVGMNPHVGKLFRFGDAIGRTPGDIGLYGSGGTMAILWLAEKVTVWTLRDGRVNSESSPGPTTTTTRRSRRSTTHGNVQGLTTFPPNCLPFTTDRSSISPCAERTFYPST